MPFISMIALKNGETDRIRSIGHQPAPVFAVEHALDHQVAFRTRGFHTGTLDEERYAVTRGDAALRRQGHLLTDDGRQVAVEGHEE